MGRPRTIYTLLVITCAWIAINLVMTHPIDPPPFVWLQGAFCLYAALVATMVGAEQKTAKLIGLIEELRRDMPQIPNRRDPEAETMAHAVDADEVLTALEEKLETEVEVVDAARRAVENAEKKH